MLSFHGAMELVQRNGDECADIARTYGEPGYTDPERGIIFADWNRVPKAIQRGLERRGFNLEWSDEWQIDYEGDSRAFRTSPDCYGWTPSYVQAESFCGGDMIPHSDILESDTLRAEYVEYLADNPRTAAFRDFDLAAEGFTRVDSDYETGFHPGQNDSPPEVFADLRKRFPCHSVVFSLDSVGQFDSHWSAWIRPQQSDGADSVSVHETSGDW